MRNNDIEENIFILPQLKNINPNVVYETGLDYIGVVLLIGNKDKIIFSDPLSKGSIKKSVKKGIKIYDIKELERYIKNERIGLDFSNCPLNFYLNIKKKAKYIYNCSDYFMKKRMKKRQDEVEKMRKASKICLDVLNNINNIKEKTEIDLRFRINEYFNKKKTSEAFPSIIAFDSNSRFPHHMPSNKKMDNIALVDRGCSYMHYCSDLTDVIIRNNPKAKKEYELIKEIFYSLFDNLVNLEKAHELHNLYIKLYKKYKLKEMPHLIGHGIGIQVHEWPVISSNSDHDLENTTITLEPSIYNKFYGLRFERVIYIGKRRASLL